MAVFRIIANFFSMLYAIFAFVFSLIDGIKLYAIGGVGVVHGVTGYILGTMDQQEALGWVWTGAATISARHTWAKSRAGGPIPTLVRPDPVSVEPSPNPPIPVLPVTPVSPVQPPTPQQGPRL